MMKPERVIVIERLVLLAGFVGLVIVGTAVDWRLGLLVASVLLIVSTSPWRTMR
jgi:hypothetical protein